MLVHLPSISSGSLSPDPARASPHAKLERSCGVASSIVARPSRVRARTTLSGRSPSMPYDQAKIDASLADMPPAEARSDVI